MSVENQTQTGKFYTAARKFQQLIGVTPAGEAIPGGPYTVTQFLVGIVVLALGFLTRPLWSMDMIADVLIIVVAAVGLTYFTGKVPGSRRSIINLINCAMALLFRPRNGVYRGKKMPTTYSKSRPVKKQAVETQITETEPATSPVIERVNITSGLDRLTADLTTAH